MTSNTLTIRPYKFKGAWVFDDPQRGLDKEALVSGTDKIIEYICSMLSIDDPESGIVISFSPKMEDPKMLTLVKIRGGDCNGTWYRLKGTDMDGWLCPALFKFFPQAPDEIRFFIEQDCLVNRIGNKIRSFFSFRKNPVVMPS